MLKVGQVQTVKAYVGTGIQIHLLLTLPLDKVVRFPPRPLYRRCALNMGLGGHQSRSERFGRVKYIYEVFLTLTEVFPCFFLSCKANAGVKLAKTGHGPHSSTLIVICVVRLINISISFCAVC